jgi:hypothetical protein
MEARVQSPVLSKKIFHYTAPLNTNYGGNLITISELRIQGWWSRAVL